MEVSKHYQEITSLGNKIVKDLFTNESYGLTRNWMSQYVAELMFKAESEQDEVKRNELQKECFATILKLWEYRNSIPGEAKPLGNLQETLGIIQSLAKNESEPFYWRHHSYDETVWGKFMHSINDAIEEILEVALLSSVSRDVFKKEKEWLEHAELLSVEEKKIIENLNYLINRSEYGLPIKILYENENEDIKPKPENRTVQIINHLQSIIDKQQDALNQLAKSLNEK